eukprot:4951712-Pleurochrysis_carterae.AAC.2
MHACRVLGFRPLPEFAPYAPTASICPTSVKEAKEGEKATHENDEAAWQQGSMVRVEGRKRSYWQLSIAIGKSFGGLLACGRFAWSASVRER